MDVSDKYQHDAYLKELVCAYLKEGKNPWDLSCFEYHGQQYNGHHGNCYQGANALLLRMVSERFFDGDPRWFTATQIGQEKLQINKGATPTYVYTFNTKTNIPYFTVYELFNGQQLKGKIRPVDFFANQQKSDVNAAKNIVTTASEKLGLQPGMDRQKWQDIFETMVLNALEKMEICPATKLPRVIINDPSNPKHRSAAKGLLQAMLSTNTLLEKCNMPIKTGSVVWASRNTNGQTNDAKLPAVWLEALQRDEISLIDTYEMASKVARYLTPMTRDNDYANDKIKSSHDRSSWISKAYSGRGRS